MSDFILRLIPEKPDYIPSSDVIEKLQNELKRLKLDADEINFKIEKQIKFVDSGSNWGKIFCPICKEQLTDEWWSQAMDFVWNNEFSSLIVQTTCCKSEVSLNDLEYEWTVGFARFVLEILNPSKEVSSESQAVLEDIIGRKLKRVNAHV